MTPGTSATADRPSEPGNRFMRRIIGAANPLVRWLLGGPLHRPLSGALLLLRLRGRRTGRVISTPVGYTVDGGRVIVVTSGSYRWWRNVGDGTEVQVRVRGTWWRGSARILDAGSAELAATVDRFVALRGETAAIQFGLRPASGGQRVMIPDPRVVTIQLEERLERRRW
jgi:deazaflavin-dependent oxidoreductase (nitroreductase family)